MKIAIPQWQGRVSPVFDASNRLLLVDIEDNREISRVEVKMIHDDPLGRAKHLAFLGVDTLICGAISSSLADAIVSSNIEIIACTCGPVGSVLDAFLHDRLSNSEFIMPGCDKQRRYFHHL
ncbi:MAG: NifB/NifX family molybdenum-iron cluster-binding protein [Desulfobacterales bacterium]|nr:NifB/NifX family molybdenum-iron cluster-binding protein [Desulfobacterales bacterium]